MNNILVKISKHIKNNLEKYLPEIRLSDLEENGKMTTYLYKNKTNFHLKN